MILVLLVLQYADVLIIILELHKLIDIHLLVEPDFNLALSRMEGILVGMQIFQLGGDDPYDLIHAGAGVLRLYDVFYHHVKV